MTDAQANQADTSAQNQDANAAAGAGAAGGKDQHINIKVKAQDGTEIYFKIKRTTQLKKLMDAYCQR